MCNLMPLSALDIALSTIGGPLNTNNDYTNIVFSPNTVISQCEQNPCENGGTCKKHALSYTCDCPPGYNGSLCQNGKHKTKQDYVD